MSEIARKEIEKFLNEWVNTKNSPHFAVLIEGKWGCGKTHFVNSLIEDEKFTKRKSIYISLFGIPNVEALETQLFYASASKTSKYAHRGLGIVSSVLKGTLRLDLDGDDQTDTIVNGKLGGITGIIEKANKNLDGALLILDDLERCSIPMAELLGVVNTLVEHGDTRVLLVANREKVKGEAFASFSEKIVGQSFLLASDPKAAMKSFTKEIPNKAVKKIIEHSSEQILQLYQTSTYHNLRSLRQFIWQLSVIIAKLKPKFRSHEGLISDLILQYYVFFIEFKLSLSDDDTTVTIADLPGAYDNDDKETWHIYDMGGLVGKNKEPSAKQKILRKYEAQNGINTVVTVRQWISILETGVVDEDWLNAEIAKADVLIGTDDWPSWRRLWHFHDWDFSDGSQGKFVADLADLNKQLDEGGYKHPNIFLHAAALLIGFSENGIHPATKLESIDRIKKYVDDQLIPNMTYDMFRNVQHSFDTGYDGLGFWNSDSADFRMILDYVRSNLEAWHEDWKKGDVAGDLLEQLKTDFSRFLGNLIVINHSPEQRFLREPILHAIEPSDFVDVWLNMGRKDERLIPGVFKDRYEYTAELLKLEGPWWEKVQAELETQKEAEVFVPRKVQVQKMIDGITGIVLDPWKLENSKPDS
jgi:KAP-like P-loop domain-containing protein